MMKLRVNPLVVDDLKGIRNFIAEDNVEKAAEAIEMIYGKFENIQLFICCLKMMLHSNDNAIF